MQPNSRIAEALAAFRRGELPRARALARAQLEAEQGPPEVDHLLGLIECRDGRLESGITHLRAALDAQPENTAFRVMLARALVDGGRASEALEVATAPTEATPAALALWHVRAEAAAAAGDHAAAADAWKILCSARPDDWRAWANYGDALAALERWEEAANALRRASTLNPTELPIQSNLVAALTKAGFYAEATDRLRTMITTGSDGPGTRLTLARLLADLGTNEEAVEQLGKAAELAVGSASVGGEGLIRIALGHADTGAEIAPAQLQPLRELALLLERTNQTDALKTLLSDAFNLGIPERELAYPAASIALRDGKPEEAKRLLLLEDQDSDAVRRHGLMAKVEDRLGDTAGAFAQAEQMHRAVPGDSEWRSRAAQYRRRLRALADILSSDWKARLAEVLPGPRRPPAFLVGFPRSGTTLLDTFLMGHPDLQVLEEQPMLGAASAVVGDLGALPNLSSADLERARSAYFGELDRHVHRDAPGLVIDKLPLNMLGLPLIRALFPDAPVIFAQRHPCDVVLSGFMQSFVMNEAMACYLDLADAADFYDVGMGVWQRSREIFPDHIHISVYERLVADPEASLRPLVDFLGLEWRPTLLDHQSTAIARGAISTPSYDQVVQPLNKTASGRWRRYEEQLAPALPVLLPWAERLGYAD